MGYNKIEYLELLKKKPMIANSDDSRKLRSYSVMTNGHLDWLIRSKREL